jgi:hypothetical protein
MATGDQTDILTRLKALLPPTWFGDDHPFITAILTACAEALAWCYSLYVYAQLQTRISTATDGWLDLIAYDFFGNNYGRTAGQSDDVFRNAIKINLFRERDTRYAIEKILEDLTGRTPIIFEPQRPLDTGAYGLTESVSFSVTPNIYRVTWAGTELLSRALRGNLLLYSEQINQSAWTKTRTTIIANAAAAPDGTFTAEKVIPSTDLNTHATLQTVTPLGSTTYTYSIYLKAAEYSKVIIYIGIFASQVAANSVSVDLSAGTVTATDLSRSGIVSVGNGWFRVWTTITTIAAPTTINASINSTDNSGASTSAGDGVSGIYAWGAQMEVGSTPTPYIQTIASPASVTDYSISNGVVTFPTAPPNSSQFLWSGVGAGTVSGYQITGNYSQFGLGDGVTSTFQITGGTTSGSNLAYGIGGGYGSQLIPYQAFVTAFRPTGSGIPYVAGYSSTPSGYSTPSRGEYASQSMITGSITDAQVYEAVAAVKMEGTIVWVRLQ